MYAINNNYKNELEQKLSLKTKSKIVVDDIEYISEIKTTPKITHKNSTMIGGFPIKTCSFEVYDVNGNLDFKDKEITVYKGIEINETIEYIPQGIFIPRAEQITTNVSQKTISFKDIQDKGQLFSDKYESSLDWSNNKTHTGLEIIQEICIKLGIELESTNFNWYDYNFKQPNFDETTTYREVISRLAEIGGAIAFINRNGKLVIKNQYNTNHTISNSRYIKLSKEQQFGLINVVTLGKKDINNDISYPTIKPENIIEWKILDNPFVDLYKEEMIEEVANCIIGMSIIPFGLTDFVDGFCYDINDVIKITDRKGNFFNGVILVYETTSRIRSTIGADVQEKGTTNYKLAGSSKEDINKVKLDVDHIKNEINLVVETQNEQSEKMSEMKLTTDELSGEVESLKNVTTTINSNSYVEIEDAAKGTLIYLSIKGNTSLLFPSSKTYLGSNTYFKNANLIIEDSNGNKTKRDIGIKSLNYLDGIYDEFVTDDTGSYIIRRIGVYDDLSLYVLTKEVKEEIPLVSIPLNEDYNKIYMESFPNLNYSLKYAKKNEYTNNFATKVEMNSFIALSEENIDLKLEKKTDNENIIAQINMSTEKDNDGSLIQIESDKLNIKNKKFNLESDEIEIESPNFSVSKEGRITSTSGKIGGFEIGETMFYTHVKDNYIYSKADAQRIVDIAEGAVATEEEKQIYDLNENGKIDKNDAAIVLRKIYGYESTEGEFYICSNDPRYSIQFSGNGTKTKDTKIGLSMMQTTELYCCRGTFEDTDDETSRTHIDSGNISCVSLTQTSLAESKKNFEKIDNALEEIKNTDIYSYNLKSEDDNHKKHLGFVIGEKYNYSHLITAVDEDGKEIGVDNYSMISLCLQAIKEQQEVIEKLEERIRELEEKINGNND